MRTIFLSLFTLFYIDGISQIVVQGTIKFLDGDPIPGVDIIEDSTNNRIRADINGQFRFQTTKSPCTITFAFVGLESKSITFVNDTTVNITLGYYDYNTRWASVGANYDLFNSVFGLQIGNGFDEEPLIHFEDFQDNFIFKVYGQTDFASDYSYGAKIGWTYPPIRYISRFSMEYTSRNYKSNDLFLNDLNLSTNLGYFRNTLIIFKLGYQKLQDNDNFGITLGVEQGMKNFYFGISSGYYFDYFHYKAYLHYGIYHNGLYSLRTTYERIDKFNFLTLGLNYTFVRNNNR
jgi:hypothetical protein